jgi:hypothetical protein
MSHQRTVMRAAVRAAIDAADLGLTVNSVWSKSVDRDRLPDAAVITPTANHAQFAGGGDSATDLAVVVRAQGSAPDDALDDLSVPLEALVTGALTALPFVLGARLTRSDIELDGAASKPLGQLQMLFTVQTRHAKGDQSAEI